MKLSKKEKFSKIVILLSYIESLMHCFLISFATHLPMEVLTIC